MNARESDPVWDVIVVGGSAAGLSAALMLGRARRRVLVIDAGVPRNRFASHMHGVLGQEGVPPHELVETGRKEAAGYGVEFIGGAVQRAEDVPGGLRVTLDTGATHQGRALIATTGLSDDLPEIPGLAERWGVSVLHCPYCHGWEVQDRHLGVLATSPASVHQVKMVRQWSDRVTLFSARIGALDPAIESSLRARGVEIVASEVVEVIGVGGQLTGVRTADGATTELDAIFTGGDLRPHDGFLAELRIERAELPLGMGSFITVDQAGKTSHPRVWAAGNVVNPGANVPVAIGAGAFAGSAVNAALVEEDFEIAQHAAVLAAAASTPSAAEFWESRYADTEQVWTGRVNRVLAEVAAHLTPGRALDLACGEGGDAVWLAQQGWHATGVDLSPTAIARGREAALAAGLSESMLTLEAADLETWESAQSFDLVTCSFLHSWPIPIPRDQILRRATGFVAPDGHLLITAHAAAPPWASESGFAHHGFPSVASELRALALDPERWQVVTSELRDRETVGPDGKPATLTDTVILARRIS